MAWNAALVSLKIRNSISRRLRNAEATLMTVAVRTSSQTREARLGTCCGLGLWCLLLGLGLLGEEEEEDASSSSARKKVLSMVLSVLRCVSAGRADSCEERKKKREFRV